MPVVSMETGTDAERTARTRWFSRVGMGGIRGARAVVPKRSERNFMDTAIVPTCRHQGCDKPRTLKGYKFGKKIFRGYCAQHYRHQKLWKNGYRRRRPTQACSVCGWKGECHRHRETPGSEGGTYAKTNVRLLCPNCHSAAHGRGEWNNTLR